MKFRIIITVLIIIISFHCADCQKSKGDESFKSASINLVTTSYMLYNRSIIVNCTFEHSRNKKYSLFHDFQYWDPYWGNLQLDYILQTRYYLKDFTKGLHLAPYLRYFINIDRPGSDGKRDNSTMYSALGFASGYKFRISKKIEMDINSNIGYGSYLTEYPYDDNCIYLVYPYPKRRLDFKFAILLGYKL